MELRVVYLNICFRINMQLATLLDIPVTAEHLTTAKLNLSVEQMKLKWAAKEF
jgi:hypothetical protein